MVKVMFALFWQKNGLGYILGIFFTTHPVTLLLHDYCKHQTITKE
jgi:hypothetical protein